MKKILALAVLAFALMAAPAMAKEGFYIGGGMELNRIVGSDVDQWANGVGVDLKVGYNDSAPRGQAGLELNRIVGSDVDQWANGVGVDLKVGYNDSAPRGQAGLEIDWFKTVHPGKTGYVDATLSGLSVNLKLFITEAKAPIEVYLLAGYGFFKIDFDHADALGYTGLLGKGVNLGIGFEVSITEHIALNVGGTYRFVTYNKATDSVGTVHITELNGDMLSLYGGFNIYF